MRVSKWGNSLAVRLPRSLKPWISKEGDKIEIRVAGRREFEIARDRSIAGCGAFCRRLQVRSAESE
jgi:antitoxin component of MazEF toxin-antitoxin module